MVKPLYRNSIVHLIKEVSKGTVTAKCGTVFKQHSFGVKGKPHGTVFDSRITCLECKPKVKDTDIEW